MNVCFASCICFIVNYFCPPYSLHHLVTIHSEVILCRIWVIKVRIFAFYFFHIHKIGIQCSEMSICVYLVYTFMNIGFNRLKLSWGLFLQFLTWEQLIPVPWCQCSSNIVHKAHLEAWHQMLRVFSPVWLHCRAQHRITPISPNRDSKISSNVVL